MDALAACAGRCSPKLFHGTPPLGALPSATASPLSETPKAQPPLSRSPVVTVSVQALSTPLPDQCRLDRVGLWVPEDGEARSRTSQLTQGRPRDSLPHPFQGC